MCPGRYSPPPPPLPLLSHHGQGDEIAADHGAAEHLPRHEKESRSSALLVHHTTCVGFPMLPTKRRTGRWRKVSASTKPAVPRCCDGNPSTSGSPVPERSGSVTWPSA